MNVDFRKFRGLSNPGKPWLELGLLSLTLLSFLIGLRKILSAKACTYPPKRRPQFTLQPRRGFSIKCHDREARSTTTKKAMILMKEDAAPWIETRFRLKRRPAYRLLQSPVA